MNWIKACLPILLTSLAALGSASTQKLPNSALPENNSFLDVSFQKGKAFIDDIQANEIRIDNVKGSQITAIESIGQLPLRIALLIDTSGSQRSEFSRLFYPLLMDAIKLLPLSDMDAACLMEFNHRVFVRQGFTSDKALLLKGIDSLRFMGGTSLFDALYLASEELGDQQNHRKAILIFTDGEDKDSSRTISDAYREAIANNVRIYMLLEEKDEAKRFLTQNGIDYSSKHKKYVTKTGGRIISILGSGSGRTDIGQIFDELNHLKRIHITHPGKPDADFKISVLRKGVKACYPSALKK